MRKKFIKTLAELAEKDDKIFLLTGDLGFGSLDEFANRFPDRFLNCGIAEQNMMGVAAGLALSGKKPYVYSIIPFAVMRCFEQIRNDVCLQNTNVKIIGMGGGFTYGTLGTTHHAIEDLALLRVLPNMTVLCPSDVAETQELIIQSYNKEGPAYIRLSNFSKGQRDTFCQDDIKIEMGKPRVLKNGKDGVIIAIGIQAGFCLDIARRIKESGIDLKIISLHTLKPIDKNLLLKEINDFKKILTVEEHNLIGGLGTIMSEIIAESGWQGRLKKLGVQDQYSHNTGSADYLRRKYLIDEVGIEKSILDFIK